MSPPHLDRGLRFLSHLERRGEFNALKGDDASLLLKIDKYPNITVETRKGQSVFRLT